MAENQEQKIVFRPGGAKGSVRVLTDPPTPKDGDQTLLENFYRKVSDQPGLRIGLVVWSITDGMGFTMGG